MANTLCRLLQDESGATVIEYAFILVTIVVLLFAAITPIGQFVSGAFNNVTNSF